MNLLNKYHTNNRFIFSQNVWMAYSREMLNCDIDKKLKHDNIRYYPHGLSLDSFNLYNIIIMLSLITFHAWV